MKVAIIGAGVSGLLTAYLLNKQGISSEIFEKSQRPGGNVYSMDLEIPGNRFADMGVNDFNLSTYKNIKSLFQELDVLKYCKPLEDSTSFATLNGSYAYQIIGDEPIDMSPDLWNQYQHFSENAPADVANNPKYAAMTVAEYIKAKPEYTEEFAEYNLYPRINGMYYMNDETPANMPIAAVMSYYTLQEGFGTAEKPNRVYMEGGVSRWIDALASACNAKIHYGTDAKIQADENGVRISCSRNKIDEQYDAVFMSCSAENTVRAVQVGLIPQAISALTSFKYYDSISVAHTFSEIMPTNKKYWSTYNIRIHEDYAQLRPYTISYVCNRHQNDAKNPQYNFFGGLEYFVTLNPDVAIPQSCILNQENGKPAITYFKHNTLDFEAMFAQIMIPYIQGKNRIYYSGGWCQGAGLHEECYHAADSAVKSFMNGGGVKLLTPQEKKYLFPDYIREVLK